MVVVVVTISLLSPGADLTAHSLMDRLDNGVLLCELAQELQDKMILASNEKVPHTEREREREREIWRDREGERERERDLV